MSDNGSQLVDPGVLAQLLTVERLSSYTQASGGHRARALALYEWNIQASAAAVSVCAMVEVILRNALDAQLVTLAQKRGWSDWLDHAPLDGPGRNDIQKARQRARRGRRPGSHGHVVAELSLGFWRYLVSRRYLTSLWVPALTRAFPGAPGDARSKQQVVEGHVQQLHFLRNRAAHHEPIHRRDLLGDLDRAVQLMQAIHPTAGAWLLAREQLSATVASRPRWASDT